MKDRAGGHHHHLQGVLPDPGQGDRVEPAVPAGLAGLELRLGGGAGLHTPHLHTSQVSLRRQDRARNCHSRSLEFHNHPILEPC